MSTQSLPPISQEASVRPAVPSFSSGNSEMPTATLKAAAQNPVLQQPPQSAMSAKVRAVLDSLSPEEQQEMQSILNRTLPPPPNTVAMLPNTVAVVTPPFRDALLTLNDHALFIYQLLTQKYPHGGQVVWKDLLETKASDEEKLEFLQNYHGYQTTGEQEFLEVVNLKQKLKDNPLYSGLSSSELNKVAENLRKQIVILDDVRRSIAQGSPNFFTDLVQAGVCPAILYALSLPTNGQCGREMDNMIMGYLHDKGFPQATLWATKSMYTFEEMWALCGITLPSQMHIEAISHRVEAAKQLLQENSKEKLQILSTLIIAHTSCETVFGEFDLSNTIAWAEKYKRFLPTAPTEQEFRNFKDLHDLIPLLKQLALMDPSKGKEPLYELRCKDRSVFTNIYSTFFHSFQQVARGTENWSKWLTVFNQEAAAQSLALVTYGL